MDDESLTYEQAIRKVKIERWIERLVRMITIGFFISIVFKLWRL